MHINMINDQNFEMDICFYVDSMCMSRQGSKCTFSVDTTDLDTEMDTRCETLITSQWLILSDNILSW